MTTVYLTYSDRISGGETCPGQGDSSYHEDDMHWNGYFEVFQGVYAEPTTIRKSGPKVMR